MASRLKRVYLDASAIVKLVAHDPRRKRRALDAIHLASGPSVRDETDAFVVYDRLAAAAEAAGLPVDAPGSVERENRG